MAAPTNACRKCIFQFANEYRDFRMTELKSILKMCGAVCRFNDQDYDQRNPFFVSEMPIECAKMIMKRTFLVRSLFEYWAEGRTHQELHDNIRKLPNEFLEPFLKHNKTYRIKIDSFNKALSSAEKLKRIETLPYDVLDFKGKVNLSSPDNSFHMLEYYGPSGSASLQEPDVIYFGRWLQDGQRDRIQHYHLQKRHFIGNTSMDAGLSLIMANMGKVSNNDLVYDPFVGSGSLLVACAHFGAYVIGTDIDYAIVHGTGKSSRYQRQKRGPDENIRTNLHTYGLGHLYVDVMLGDASKHEMLRQTPIFDAIITDPPYGIREQSKKTSLVNITDNEPDKTPCWQSSKTDYTLSESFIDLLNFSGKFLRIGGRLVYWLPVCRSDYVEENIPHHPCLNLIGNCEQQMSTNVSRRLIVMEKYRNIMEADTDKGGVLTDHYEGDSFRSRYFRAVEKTVDQKT